MIPSEKQAAIYKEWQESDKNITINAVAGSGKTTTLLHLISLCKYKTLYLAFNKTIQKETEEKLVERGLVQGKAMTLHSLGLASIRYIYPRVEIDNFKNWKIITELEKRKPKQFSMRSGYFDNYEEILKLKYCLIDMNDISRIYMEDDPEVILDHMITMDKPVFFNNNIDLGDLWREFINIREEKYNKVPLVIDYTDMIYLPARGDYYIPFDPYYLLIDEAQDLNLAQHRLIDNFIKQGTIKKWIAVGDRNQSIYGFSGSYASSFDLFKTKDNVIEMPLDICYRCPVNVIKSANTVYPVLIPHKTEEGIVKSTINIDIIREKPGAMVICRNKNPLISLYFDLISRDIPTKLYGDDIYSSVVRFLKSYKNMTIHKAINDISSELISLAKNLDTDKKKILYASIKSNYDNFLLLYSKLGFTTSEGVSSVIERFEDLFKSKDPQHDIVLCTIHKAKGLEADVVFILNEFLIPSKFAKSPQQLVQERNLKYVARTRAKKEMYFLDYKPEPVENNYNIQDL